MGPIGNYKDTLLMTMVVLWNGIVCLIGLNGDDQTLA